MRSAKTRWASETAAARTKLENCVSVESLAALTSLSSSSPTRSFQSLDLRGRSAHRRCRSAVVARRSAGPCTSRPVTRSRPQRHQAPDSTSDCASGYSRPRRSRSMTASSPPSRRAGPGSDRPPRQARRLSGASAARSCLVNAMRTRGSVGGNAPPVGDFFRDEVRPATARPAHRRAVAGAPSEDQI